MLHVSSSLALAVLFTVLCGACSSSGASSASTMTSSSAGGASSAAALGAPSGTVACGSEANVDSYAAGLKKHGANGEFDFELVSSTPAPPALNDNTFVVRITGPDGSALGGQLGAVLFMPEHGHDSPEAPVITFDAAAGTFTLDPMDLFMVGLWRITLNFAPSADPAAGTAGASDAAAAGDSAVFQFCVD